MKSTKKFDSIHFLVARRPDGYIRYIQITIYHTTACYVYRQSRCFVDTYKQEQLQALATCIEQTSVPFTTINSIMENCRKYMSRIDFMPDRQHPLYKIVNYVANIAKTFKYRKS